MEHWILAEMERHTERLCMSNMRCRERGGGAFHKIRTERF